MGEQLPEMGKIVVGYEEDSGKYDIVQFDPSMGWKFQGCGEEHGVRITHWLDASKMFVLHQREGVEGGK